MKKYAIIESDSTIFITSKIKEKKDFIIVGKRPFEKGRLCRVINEGKKGIGFKIDLREDGWKKEIAQEVLKKNIVLQIVRGLTKKFAWKEFFEGIAVGYIAKYIYDVFMKYLEEHPFQPAQPQYPYPIENPFQPFANVILILGIIGIIGYFIFKLFKERW